MISITGIIRAAIIAVLRMLLVFSVVVAEHRHARKRMSANETFERRVTHKFVQLKIRNFTASDKNIGWYSQLSKR
jgi:hypothetical protein